MSIRNEKPEDYRTVEELIKKTFWNLSVPGCNEHYLVHQIRKSSISLNSNLPGTVGEIFFCNLRCMYFQVIKYKTDLVASGIFGVKHFY